MSRSRSKQKTIPRIRAEEIVAIAEGLGLFGADPESPVRTPAAFQQGEELSEDALAQTPWVHLAANGFLRCDDHDVSGMGPFIYCEVRAPEQSGPWPQEMKVTYRWNPRTDTWQLSQLDLLASQSVPKALNAQWTFNPRTGKFREAMSPLGQRPRRKTVAQLQAQGVWVPPQTLRTQGETCAATQEAVRLESLVADNSFRQPPATAEKQPDILPG